MEFREWVDEDGLDETVTQHHRECLGCRALYEWAARQRNEQLFRLWRLGLERHLQSYRRKEWGMENVGSIPADDFSRHLTECARCGTLFQAAEKLHSVPARVVALEGWRAV